MRSKRVNLSRKITTSELRSGNGECRVYTPEEIQEKNKQLKIQILKEKLMKMNAAKSSDYSFAPNLYAA